MKGKEQLHYLVDQFCNGSYTVNDFCSEFTRIFDLETDYQDLSPKEYQCFHELSDMASRFSDDEYELKIPNMYFSELEILNKTKHVKKILDLAQNERKVE